MILTNGSVFYFVHCFGHSQFEFCFLYSLISSIFHLLSVFLYSLKCNHFYWNPLWLNFDFPYYILRVVFYSFHCVMVESLSESSIMTIIRSCLSESCTCNLLCITISIDSICSIHLFFKHLLSSLSCSTSTTDSLRLFYNAVI